MADVSIEAGSPRAVTAKRRNTKPSVSAKEPGAKTLRVQLHIGERTVERLRVHTALSHRNDSRVVEEILCGWLARYGKGRELFPPEDLEGGLEVPTE
jgi:hypothetical protein